MNKLSGDTTSNYSLAKTRRKLLGDQRVSILAQLQKYEKQCVDLQNTISKNICDFADVIYYFSTSGFFKWAAAGISAVLTGP